MEWPLFDIEIPRATSRKYLRAFGVSAIYVIAPPAGSPVILGHGLDLGRSLALARRRWSPEVEVAGVVWATGDSAERVCAAAQDALASARKGVRFDCTAEVAMMAIRAEASRASVRLTDHAAVMARVHAPPGEIEAVLAEAQRGGVLHTFNQPARGSRPC